MKRSIFLGLCLAFSTSAFATSVPFGYGVVESDGFNLAGGQALSVGKLHSIHLDRAAGYSSDWTKLVLAELGTEKQITFWAKNENVKKAGDGKGMFISGSNLVPKQNFNVYFAVSEAGAEIKEQSFCSTRGEKMVRLVEQGVTRGIDLRITRAQSVEEFLNTDSGQETAGRSLTIKTNVIDENPTTVAHDGKFRAAGPCEEGKTLPIKKLEMPELRSPPVGIYRQRKLEIPSAESMD